MRFVVFKTGGRGQIVFWVDRNGVAWLTAAGFDPELPFSEYRHHHWIDFTVSFSENRHKAVRTESSHTLVYLRFQTLLFWLKEAEKQPKMWTSFFLPLERIWETSKHQAALHQSRYNWAILINRGSYTFCLMNFHNCSSHTNITYIYIYICIDCMNKIWGCTRVAKQG